MQYALNLHDLIDKVKNPVVRTDDLTLTLLAVYFCQTPAEAWGALQERSSHRPEPLETNE